MPAFEKNILNFLVGPWNMGNRPLSDIFLAILFPFEWLYYEHRRFFLATYFDVFDISFCIKFFWSNQCYLGLKEFFE